MNVMGIDIGTTGCKVCTFSQTGQLLYRAYREYQREVRDSGTEELDPELVASLVKECIRENNQALAGFTARGLALSVSGDECILLDRKGDSLGPVIMSRDSRGKEEEEWFREQFGSETLFSLTGLPLHRKYGIVRLLWYRNHCPEIFEKIAQVMTWEDFLLKRLGAKEAVCSYSSSARLMTVDLKEKRYLGKVLDGAGVKQEWLSRMADSGSVVGTMQEEIGKQLGFDSPPVLVCGGFDQACAGAGAGLCESGSAVVSSGTMEALSFSSKQPLLSSYFLKGQYPTNYHLFPGHYICSATNVGGGAILKWYRDNLEVPEMRANGYEAILGQCREKPSGLLLLPHFAGSGPPYKDADSLGALVGLRVSTGREEILQGILEGITFELRQNIQMIEEGSGKKMDFLRIVGGGSKSNYWMQLKADITGKKVIRMENEEAGCTAAAMAVTMALGVYRDWGEASAHFIRPGEEFFPNPARTKAYDPYYKIYQTLYPCLCHTFHHIKELVDEKG